jgi:NAD(P)-dependent dehydrogenase (short-subunit alcohol dehydrogenase family)
MNRLHDRVIIVTGGSGLLGKEIVQKIRSEGGIPYNADIAADDDLDRGIIQCDISNEQSINQAIDKVLQRHGRIDGIVNNAYPRTQDWGNKFEEISLSSWKQNVDLQLNSLFQVCQKVLSIMMGQKGGSIVNIGSIYGVVGPDFSIYDGTGMTMPAAYSAIKGGIVNFTRYLASYYGPHGIRINCVSPGGILNGQSDLFVENYCKKVPMRRMGSPSDISAPICFLLSDEAKYITGHNLVIDGGWTSI